MGSLSPQPCWKLLETLNLWLFSDKVEAFNPFLTFLVPVFDFKGTIPQFGSPEPTPQGNSILLQELILKKKKKKFPVETTVNKEVIFENINLPANAYQDMFYLKPKCPTCSCAFTEHCQLLHIISKRENNIQKSGLHIH